MWLLHTLANTESSIKLIKRCEKFTVMFLDDIGVYVPSFFSNYSVNLNFSFYGPFLL